MKKRYDKRILVITHQLSRTGAPIVLLDMIQVCRKQGYEIGVITMLDGELRESLKEMNIPVTVQEHFFQDSQGFYEQAECYDMVIANTLITYEVIHILNGSGIPVLWWIHEGRPYFEYFSSVLPDFRRLGSNIHVFSVGHCVQDIIRERYGYMTEILHFGVKDVPSVPAQKNEAKGRVVFLTVGSYSRIKAQDILVEAIRLLPQKYVSRAEFVFCGDERMYDESIFTLVKQLAGEYDNVTMLSLIPHNELLGMMEQCDCLVVPSRMDSIPTVAVEVMMKEALCLCTDVCGVAHYIEDGVNGFTVPSEDAEALARKIEFIIDNRELLGDVKKRGRSIYEEHFSPEVIEPFVLGLLDEYMHPREKEMKELAKCILDIREEMRRGLLLSEEEQKQLENSVAIVTDYIDKNYEDFGEEQSNRLDEFVL